MHLSLLVLSAFLTIGLTNADPHWGYPDLDLDEDFPKWGGICDTGSRQSPINLSVKGSLKGVFDKFKFNNYGSKQTGVVMVNNGHSIQLSDFPMKMELEGGPLNDEYEVEQIHLHWWSEHTIDGIRYPLETHIVHRNKKYPNMTMAANFKDGIAVIGVLYHNSNERNEAIDRIAENVDSVKTYDQINKPVRMKNSFVVHDLFPVDGGYLTYPGSLTTPSCAESVTWIVMLETFPITMDQVAKFQDIECDKDKNLKNNYRVIQKSHNRAVTVVLTDGRGAAVKMNVSLPLLLFGFVAILIKSLH